MSEEISQDQKDELVRAVLAMKALMASGDAAKIRAHLLKSQGSDPKAVEAYTNVSDAEIKEAAAMIAANPVSEAEFYTTSTEWEVGNDKATITIHRSPTDEVEFTLRSVDGVWY